MFLGSFDHVLDDKGRTSLPKEFREKLNSLEGGAFLTAYPECLVILPAEKFEERRQKLAAKDHIGSVQRLQRLIIGMASPCAFDKQGRILIAPKLRQWAELGRDIVFCGVGGEIEIWDRSRHYAELLEARANYSDYTRDLEGLRRDVS